MKINKNKNINISSITLYLGILVVFVVFQIVCNFCGKNFITLVNIFNIITQSSIISIIAIGASLVILTGGIDLSVGSIVGFVGIGGQPISSFPKGLGSLMCTKVFNTIPISVFYVIFFYLLMIFVMQKTIFGRHIYSIGGNIQAARLSGVRVYKTEMLVYVLSGVFAAIGGVMLLARLTYADPNAGAGYEMNAIAATVIGGISLSGGKGKIGNTLIGAILLSTLTSGLQILNVATYYQSIVIGMVIVGAVFADKQKERKSE